MAKLQRITGKLFGANANPADNATAQGPEIGQFGSALAATYVGTADIATIQALPAWQQGFIGAVTPTNQYPPLPEMTGFGKVLSYQTNYLLQQGIAEWDSGTTYYANSFCSLNGNIYISNTDGNINNDPTSDRVNWRIFENGGRSHNLFDIVVKDQILTYENTMGFTIQGGWAYKEASAGNYYGYPDFYNKCIAERNAGTQTLTTLGSSQITTYNNANGHIYYDIADKSIVDTYLATYGVAWFYGVDTDNERILMPRNNYFFKMATSDPGELNLPGAPSISHSHTFTGNTATGYAYCLAKADTACGGVFSNSGEASPSGQGDAGAGSDNKMTFSMTPSGTISTWNSANNIYGRQTNQIVPTSANGILYIVTGNTVDEGAITINQSLINAIAAMQAQEQTSIGNIDDAGDDAIDDIGDAKDAAIEDIQDETSTVIADATEQADRARDEADRAEAAAQTAVAGQMQADWTQTDTQAVDYIKNKPTGVVTETGTQTLTNKTISGDDNTISNLAVSNFAQSAILNYIRTPEQATNTVLVTEAGISSALNAINTQINEIQLAKNPNLSIIGDLTINSGNVSGFSESDYLQFPYIWNFGNYSWTMEIQFTTDSDVTTQQNILNSYYGISLAIISGHFVLAISSNGTSWDIANSSTGTYTVEGETAYTLKLSWDGSDYKLAYSLDEETFTDDITVNSTTVHNATQEYVGASPNLFGAGTAYAFSGTINLNKWSLTVNDLVFWFGMDDVGLSSRANVNLSNLTQAGIEVIKDNSAVKTVNNTSPDSSGNITISIPSTSNLANTNLSNISSTGQKVIDGQWTQSQHRLGTSTAINTYNCDITSFLPSDNYKYEVMVNLFLYCNNSNANSRVRISSDIWQELNIDTQSVQAQAGGYGRTMVNTFIIPVGTGRKIVYKVFNSTADTLVLDMWGYRRIGTNT